MRLFDRKHRMLTIWLATVLVASQIATLFASPLAVQAKTLETSSDPSDEIVYVDENGVIRVLDTQGDPLVQWYSPTGGWEYITLVDVNNDTDMEIAALGQNGDFLKVAVFDPVVTSGATDPNKKLNGIPWNTLYETQFPGIALYIIGGDFDTNVNGEELAILFRDGSGGHHLRIWKANELDNQSNPTGRVWIEHIARDYASEKYETGAAGQLNGEGADELILVDEDSEETRFDVFIVDRDMERMDGKNTDTDEYKQVTVGQALEGGKEELGVYVSVDRADKRSALVYNVDGDNELDSDEDWQWAFAPQPRQVFFADIFGNNDDEFFILRHHPESWGARLIMRDDWGNDRERYDEDYDVDLDGTDYDTGAGGDIDGDGKDEIVLLRDEDIRILTRPEDRAEDENYISIYDFDYELNDDMLHLGNLDAIGFSTGPSFGVSQNMFEVAVPVGTQSDFYSFSVTNVATADPLTFNVLGGASWLPVSPTTATTTPGNPAVISLRFDATNLSVGKYETTLTLQSGQPVQNQPYEIKVVLDVLPAVVQAKPPTAAFVHYPCTEDPTGQQSMTVRLEGTAGLNFRGAVIAVPAQTAAASADVFGGEVTGGEIDANGNMVLYDANGNSRVIETGGVSAAAALSTTWHIDDAVSSWVKNVYSDETRVPTNLTIEVDLSALDANFPTQQAVFVTVADTRAGDPPDNISGLSIVALCASSQLRVPVAR